MPHGAGILTAKPIAGHDAGGEWRDPGQDDPDAAGVLDLGPGPEMGTRPGSSSEPEPARGHARERRGGAGRRTRTRRSAAPGLAIS